MNARKQLSRVGLLTLMLIAVVMNVRSSASTGTAMDDFCFNWSFYDFSCSFQDFSTWEWSGEYDFTEFEENALEYGTEMCDDLFDSCIDSCESTEFVEWLADEHELPTACFITWGGSSCENGEEGSWSCTCSFLETCLE